MPITAGARNIVKAPLYSWAMIRYLEGLF